MKSISKERFNEIKEQLNAEYADKVQLIQKILESDEVYVPVPVYASPSFYHEGYEYLVLNLAEAQLFLKIEDYKVAKSVGNHFIIKCTLGDKQKKSKSKSKSNKLTKEGIKLLQALRDEVRYMLATDASPSELSLEVLEELQDIEPVCVDFAYGDKIYKDGCVYFVLKNYGKTGKVHELLPGGVDGEITDNFEWGIALKK